MAEKVFVCQNCGYETIKWLGKCPQCQGWNTLVEEIKYDTKYKPTTKPTSKAYKLTEISVDEEKRLKTNIKEFDKLLGGGIVPSSVTLLGGPPGIGKSTLMLQISGSLANTDYKVLYVSGEESIYQLKSRANRLNVASENVYLLSETNLESIMDSITALKPDIVIIDSIQTIYTSHIPSPQGSVSQLKETTQQITNFAKSDSTSFFILGHITKSGEIAGPKLLEHIVDTVLYFEPEKSYPYRILSVEKNRFGPANELAIFEMESTGLKEVQNPSTYFISERTTTSGSTITSIVEGTRPILLEIQALLAKTNFSLPRRIFTGLDFNRGIILISVVEKYLNLSLQNFDVFINVVGGIRLKEPSADLAICTSIISAYNNITIPQDTLFLGEVGLGGEIRSIPYVLQRVLEAEKIKIKKIVLPKPNLPKLSMYKGEAKLIGISNIQEIWNHLKYS